MKKVKLRELTEINHDCSATIMLPGLESGPSYFKGCILKWYCDSQFRGWGLGLRPISQWGVAGGFRKYFLSSHVYIFLSLCHSHFPPPSYLVPFFPYCVTLSWVSGVGRVPVLTIEGHCHTESLRGYSIALGVLWWKNSWEPVGWRRAGKSPDSSVTSFVMSSPWDGIASGDTHSRWVPCVYERHMSIKIWYLSIKCKSTWKICKTCMRTYIHVWENTYEKYTY